MCTIISNNFTENNEIPKLFPQHNTNNELCASHPSPNYSNICLEIIYWSGVVEIVRFKIYWSCQPLRMFIQLVISSKPILFYSYIPVPIFLQSLQWSHQMIRDGWKLFCFGLSDEMFLPISAQIPEKKRTKKINASDKLPFHSVQLFGLNMISLQHVLNHFSCNFYAG